MKKLYSSVFSICLIASLTAQPIVDEKFQYGVANGDLTTVSGGNWVQTGTLETNPIQYTAGSNLSFPGFVPAGGLVTLASTGGQDVNRTVPAYTSGSIYYSALVNVSSTQGVGDYFMHFSVSSTTTTFLGRVFVRGGTTPGTIQFGVMKNSGGATPYASQEFALNTTYAVVVEYTFVEGGTTNDSVSLFVFDASTGVPVTEPETPLISQMANTDASSIAAIALRQGVASAAPTVRVDDITFADTWSGVVALLPARLIDFQVSLDGQQRPVTRFRVDNDGSVNSFDIESSTDGSAFSRVTTIAAGDRRGVTDFSFQSPQVQNASLVYYRLRMNYRAGTSTYSKVIPVRLLQKGKLLIAPNPVSENGSFTIAVPALGDKPNRLTILSGAGQLMYRTTLAAGTRQLSLTLPTLTAGVYRVVLDNGTELQSVPLVVR